MIETEQGGDLLERISSLRKQLAARTRHHHSPPSVSRDNVQLDANKYSIKMRGIIQGRG